MDYESDKKAYFVNPQPEGKFDFIGLHGIALFFSDYNPAIAYYTEVLGPPAYVEGKFTNGWQIGNIWLTIFPANAGNPQNAEIHFLMNSPAEAERLHQTFINASGKGEEPSDQLMYEPIRYCSMQDPFGTSILIVSQLPRE